MYKERQDKRSICFEWRSSLRETSRVGFRDAVQSIARRLGLSGIVQNMEPYDVRIIAEGEEAALKESEWKSLK